MLQALEEKQNRIKGIISFVKMMKTTAPTRIPKYLESIDISAICREKSFKEAWESNVAYLSKLTDTGRRRFEEFGSVQDALLDIGALKEENIHSKKVIERVINFNGLCTALLLRLDEGEREKYNESSIEERCLVTVGTGAWIAELCCSDPGTVKYMEIFYGPGVETFIMEAIMDFGEFVFRLLNIEQTFREAFEEHKRNMRRLMQNDGKNI